MVRIQLSPGRDKPVRRGHPWVFSGAIRSVEGRPEAGDIIDLHAADGDWLARGYWNGSSQIRVRLLSWEAGEAIDTEFWRRRLRRAFDLRGMAPGGFGGANGARRLVNAESDGLAGLVLDRYGDWLVLQALTLGIERRKTELAELAAGLASELGLGGRGVWERSDLEVRAKEGLEPASGLLWGEAPPERVAFLEQGVGGREIQMLADLREGHKTGFYLDQRVNRRRVAGWCAGAGEVLNAFAYTGAFASQLLAAGAGRVLNLDSSGPALALARESLALNGFEPDEADFVEADVFTQLRAWREAGRRFDAIVLDPPKFAQSAGQVERATRAYKDINLLALQLLEPGGILATFSCSGHVSTDLFQKVVFGAMVDAGREAQIVEVLGQAPDHPVHLAFPEAAYLKGLVLRAL
ncbi:MAG: class I SAM-dependent rRNA methyltransferase [Chloroflexi bacterium]|nr:class I SAM-dependent rRNA methyltransferase [Chloroflexota bacterium]